MVLQQMGGSFSFDQLMTAIATVAGGKAAMAQGYTSYLDWRADLRKHTRVDLAIDETVILLALPLHYY